MRDGATSGALLDWYDIHARDMPWRVSPADRAAGVRPDPYRVWLSEVMLQQTTVAAVRDYFARFTALWPTVGDLAAAEDGRVMAEWAGLGYYARARNLLKCARAVVRDHGGVFPDTLEALMSLPGIGPYTASDLGATICTPRSPACGICPWRDPCAARAEGTAPELPKKTPKKQKPVRHGGGFIARRRDGAWLMERRPESGLLGGTLGWPGTAWVAVSEEVPEAIPPAEAEWRLLPAEALHTFTHFHLRLSSMVAQGLPASGGETASATLRPGAQGWVPRGDFRPSDMPTVMRKAFDLARSAMDNDA